MPREPRWARDGPSRRAPETSLERGNFSPRRKTGWRGKTFGYFGSFQSDSPEEAKHRVHAYAEATLKYPGQRSRSAKPERKKAPALPADRGRGPLLQWCAGPRHFDGIEPRGFRGQGPLLRKNRGSPGGAEAGRFASKLAPTKNKRPLFRGLFHAARRITPSAPPSAPTTTGRQRTSRSPPGARCAPRSLHQ